MSVIVIGCGLWGRNIAKSFKELGALIAVSDLNQDQANVLAQELDVPALSVDEVFQSNCQGISIATPTISHFELAIKALSYGKHVLIEKPLTETLTEAHELAKLAEKMNKIVMVGHLLHYHSGFQKVQELLQQGEIGNLQYIRFHRLGLGRIRSQEDVILDLAPHDISMLLNIVKEVPQKVSVQRAMLNGQKRTDISDIYIYFEKVTASIHLSWWHPIKQHQLTVVADQGALIFDDTQPWDRKVQEITYTSDINNIIQTGSCYHAITPCPPLLEECRHFLMCVRSDSQPITDINEAIRVMHVMEKILKN